MIHQYKLDGYNIVLDICSGSVHAVDELAYDIIAMFETESRDMIIRELTEKYRSTEGVTPEEVGECYDQIAQLKAAGKLFSGIVGIAAAAVHHDRQAAGLQKKALPLPDIQSSKSQGGIARQHGKRNGAGKRRGNRRAEYPLASTAAEQENRQKDIEAGDPQANVIALRVDRRKGNARKRPDHVQNQPDTPVQHPCKRGTQRSPEKAQQHRRAAEGEEIADQRQKQQIRHQRDQRHRSEISRDQRQRKHRRTEAHRLNGEKAARKAGQARVLLPERFGQKAALHPAQKRLRKQQDARRRAEGEL